MFLLYVCAPVLVGLSLVAVALNYMLRFLFRLMHVPNFTSANPTRLLSWMRLAPPDILFRLASLATLNLVLYWLPIYYWTTYTPSGDDRDGGVLSFSMLFCPVSWVLGGLCYAQVWRVRQTVRHQAAFYVASSLLLLVVLSTLIPQVQFYVRMSQLLRDVAPIHDSRAK
ncbi:MAG: hypothetical protein QOD03_1207 [Verrucomicrobiota bacterium]